MYIFSNINVADVDEEDANDIWRIVRERRERFRKKTYQATELPLRQIEQAKVTLFEISWYSNVLKKKCSYFNKYFSASRLNNLKLFHFLLLLVFLCTIRFFT
jgi:hypothetical protein